MDEFPLIYLVTVYDYNTVIAAYSTKESAQDRIDHLQNRDPNNQYFIDTLRLLP